MPDVDVDGCVVVAVEEETKAVFGKYCWHRLVFSSLTIEWWHGRNQAPKIKVGRFRRLPLTSYSLWSLVGFNTLERLKCAGSRTRLVILPKSFVSVVLGIDPWCNIRHAAPQLKLALTSPETTWDPTQGLISSSFLIAGNIYSKRTSSSSTARSESRRWRRG